MALHPSTGPNDTFNIIALCAGVGGLELGLKIAEPDSRTVCFVEREVFAASLLVARMEDKALDHAPVWDDVKSFDGKPWRGRVHCITGGYPCQPFSFSGRQKGAKDPRHLWPDIARIVDEVRPEWCFFENVEGHLSLGAAEVSQSLRGMGYTPKAGLFSAREVGASMFRKRLYIVAHANDRPLCQSGAAGIFSKGAAVSRQPKSSGQPDLARQGGTHLDNILVDDGSGGCTIDANGGVAAFPPAPSEFGAWSAILDRRPDLQPELFGLDDGVADRLDRTRAAGNGVCPLAAANAWRTLKAAHFDR